MKQLKQHVSFLLLIIALIGCGPALQQSSIQPAVLPVVDNNTTAVQTLPTGETAETESPNLLGDLVAQQQAFINLYEQVNPAVVNITTESGQGSGFVYSVDGYVVTNNHVVVGAQQIIVVLADGTEHPATLVGRDPDSDLAVVKITAEPGDLTVAPLTDSESLQVGQIVIAIGNPFGLQSSMTTGIISGLGRLLPVESSFGQSTYSIPDIIQTDAAINPGNSGGPLLDIYGRVVGVNSAIESPVRSSSGVGYAIPANMVAVVVPQLIQNGEVQHPWLGISGGDLTADLAQAMGLNRDQQGVLVSSIITGGPAALAGLQGGNNQNGLGGDVITSIDGRSVNEFDDLLGYILQHTEVGQQVELQILRNGQPQTIQLTLQARPASG